MQEVFRPRTPTATATCWSWPPSWPASRSPAGPPGQDLYVNVSARALTSERFLAGLPARLDGVVVELGENADDVELERLADVAARLRARGARVALDDVGAGAQEFARLARLRPDVVKIDRLAGERLRPRPGQRGGAARAGVVRRRPRASRCARRAWRTRRTSASSMALGVTHVIFVTADELWYRRFRRVVERR